MMPQKQNQINNTGILAKLEWNYNIISNACNLLLRFYKAYKDSFVSPPKSRPTQALTSQWIYVQQRIKSFPLIEISESAQGNPFTFYQSEKQLIVLLKPWGLQIHTGSFWRFAIINIIKMKINISTSSFKVIYIWSTR